MQLDDLSDDMTLDLTLEKMDDKGLFAMKSNLPMNEEFISLVLLDDQMRDLALELKILEVDASASVSET